MMKPTLAVLLAAGLLAFEGRAGAGESRAGVVVAGTETLVAARDEVAVWDVGTGWMVAAKANPADPIPQPPVSESSAGESAAAGEHPVFYVDGMERSRWARRILTGRISVRFDTERPEPSADSPDPAAIAAAVAADFKLGDEGAAEGAAPWWVLRAEPPLRILDVVGSVRDDPRVAEAEVVWARQMAHRSLPNDPLLPRQWHLSHALPGVDGGPPVDLSVLAVWGPFDEEEKTGWRGRGVRLGIIDDGIDDAHPEFAGDRLDMSGGRNWNGDAIDDAAARGAYDKHGTVVAGLAAASAHNKTGVAGVAPEAQLVSLRLTAAAHDDVDEAQAIGYLANKESGPRSARTIDIKSASWGPADGAFRLAGPGPLARQAFENAARYGRGGRGTIFVWAAGNGGAMGEDANADGFVNNPHVIAVGAIDSLGRVPPYSEGGACLAVVAPSGAEGALPIVTTDRPGRAGFNPPVAGDDLADDAYTERFGGTSAAAPQVAGVCALMLEANPALGWRDVKEILLRSARRVNPESPAWFTNAVGLRFHPRQGAGLVDAAAATALAAKWSPLGPQIELRSAARQAGAIPDDAEIALVRTFEVKERRRVEHALLRLSASHPYRGDLKITLTSPGGTSSVLAPSYFAAMPQGQANYDEWVFCSLHFWGEDSAGKWTLRVADVMPDEAGRFLGAELTLLGSEILPAPVITSVTARTAPVGEPFEHIITASNGPVAFDATGSLPSGLEFDAAAGRLYGKPNALGTFSLVFLGSNAGGTGTQSFQLTVVGGYEAWRTAQGVPDELAAPTDDADRDGWLNLLEYACGGSAMVPDAAQDGTCDVDPDGAPFVRFARRPDRADVLWQVEHSADGIEWTAVAESRAGEAVASLLPERFAVDETEDAADMHWVTVADTVSSAPHQAWFRLRVTLQP